MILTKEAGILVFDYQKQHLTPQEAQLFINLYGEINYEFRKQEGIRV